MRETKSTNPQIVQLIQQLKAQSRTKDVAVWRSVAEKLSKPSRQRISVNLSKINRCTEKNATIVVPGKVLASGTLDHAVTVAAFDASDKAKEKLAAAKAKYLTITELMEKNPEGSNVTIMG
jgi:large subunit ribosomal protein L18e